MAGLAVAGQGFVSATNFLTTLIVGRACVKEELGLYGLGFSVLVFVMQLQVALIITPYVVYEPRVKGHEHRIYTGSSLIHQAALSLVLIPVFFLAGLLATAGYGPQGFAPVAWALVFAVVAALLKEYVRRICFANVKMIAALIVDAATAALQIGILAILWRTNTLTAARAFWVTAFANGLAATVWLAMNRGMFHLQWGTVLRHFAANWQIGKWSFASAFLYGIGNNFYPWLVERFQGTAQTGEFQACLGVAGLGNIVLIGVYNFLGPRIARVYAEKGIAYLKRFVMLTSMAMCCSMAPICFVLWSWGDPLVVLVFGDKYAGNGMIVFVLALNLMALAMALALSYALFALEKADFDFIVNIAGVLILVTVGIWLVRAYGPLGAALGLLASNAAALATRYGVFLYCSRHQKKEAPA